MSVSHAALSRLALGSFALLMSFPSFAEVAPPVRVSIELTSGKEKVYADTVVINDRHTKNISGSKFNSDFTVEITPFLIDSDHVGVRFSLSVVSTSAGPFPGIDKCSSSATQILPVGHATDVFRSSDFNFGLTHIQGCSLSLTFSLPPLATGALVSPNSQ